jgi:6-phosphogluconolactonase
MIDAVGTDTRTVSTDRISILALGTQGPAQVAARIAAAGRAAHARHGRFAFAASPDALSEPLVEALARGPIGAQAFWRDTHLFWTDTCFSGCDAPRSRARALAARLPVPATGLHLDVADRPDPLRAADAYEQALRAFFGLGAGAVPRFDLVLLAIDEQGRVAGLRPGSRALDEIGRLAVADFAPGQGRSVVTFTPPVFASAAAILALAGADSIEAMRERLFPRGAPWRRSPLEILRAADGEVAVVLDHAPRLPARASHPADGAPRPLHC